VVILIGLGMEAMRSDFLFVSVEDFLTFLPGLFIAWVIILTKFFVIMLLLHTLCFAELMIKLFESVI